MTYSFKKYIPAYATGNKLCFGFVNEPSNYLEIEDNLINRSNFEKLLQEGISQEEFLKNPFFLKLKKMGFLEKFEDMECENRNFTYIKYLTDDNINKSKLEKKIIIFGAGGGGSTLAYYLAQFGFKNIYIIDGDIVSENDVLRNFPFKMSSIGKRKVDVLKELFLENFNVNLKTSIDMPLSREDIIKHIDSFNPYILVKACDPAGLFINNLNDVCFEKKIPYMCMSYSFENIKIGPFYIPGITSCFKGISDFNVNNFGEHYKVELFERPFEKYLYHPSIIYNINILSSLVFKEILFFCLEKYEFCQTLGRLIIFNPLNFEARSRKYRCKEDCVTCLKSKYLD